MVLLIFAAAGILLLFYLFTRKSEQPVQKVNIQADIQHDEEAEIFLAGGCFWGVQKFLSSLEGVRFTECGYANGTTDNPTYEDVRMIQALQSAYMSYMIETHFRWRSF